MPCGFRKHLEVRDGRFANPGGHERGIVRIAAYGRVDCPRLRQAFTHHDSPIDAVYLPGRHLLDEPRISRLAFGEHHRAGGVAIETMHDAGPGWIPSGYTPAQERVHERT